MCPQTQRVNFFGSCRGERHRRLNSFYQIFSGQGFFGGKTGIHGGLDCRVNLSAGIIAGTLSQTIKIKVGWTLLVTGQTQTENRAAFLSVRQVYQEQLVKASFANQLWGQDVHIIRSSGDEDGPGAVLHPGKKCSQKARSSSGIGGG